MVARYPGAGGCRGAALLNCLLDGELVCWEARLVGSRVYAVGFRARPATCRCRAQRHAQPFSTPHAPRALSTPIVPQAEGASRDLLLLDIALDGYFRLLVERMDKGAMQGERRKLSHAQERR